MHLSTLFTFILINLLIFKIESTLYKKDKDKKMKVSFTFLF